MKEPNLSSSGIKAVDTKEHERFREQSQAEVESNSEEADKLSN